MSRDPQAALVAALTEYLGPLEKIESKVRQWASATFVGSRHVVAFATAAPTELIEALPDVELPMVGQFVADLTFLWAVPSRGALHVCIEVLIVQE